jgi:hypothetical protein
LNKKSRPISVFLLTRKSVSVTAGCVSEHLIGGSTPEQTDQAKVMFLPVIWVGWGYHGVIAGWNVLRTNIVRRILISYQLLALI